MNKPLILVSGLRESEALAVLPWLRAVGRPVYLEATSRLRGLIPEFELACEKSISRMDFDGVIRVGNVPTLRYWRDLETAEIPVHNFSNIPLSGLPRVREVRGLAELTDGTGAEFGGRAGDTRAVENGGLNFARAKFESWSEAERRADRELAQTRDRLLKEFPLSEPAWVRWLSRQIPAGARVLLGNSLPIREWDFVTSAPAKDLQPARDIFANRGTNGIDGLISTFAGLAQPNTSNWAMIGDLSAMYDLTGPWALRQRPLKSFNLAVVNNGGGKIFHRMFRNPLFLNEHKIGFEGWAGMWDMDYVKLNEPRELGPELGPRVIEILPAPEQTEAFMNAWEKA